MNGMNGMNGTNGESFSMLSSLSLLVQHLSADWTRRGRSLLEIGCGDGRVLEILWTLGFDVSGLEHDPDKAGEANALLGGRADIRLGAYDHVPYEDDSFDYVVLVQVFGQHPEMDALLREAMRVATRNILLIFPNAWSLAWAAARLSGRKKPSLAAYSPFAILRELRRACPGCALRLRSILPGPPGSWTAHSFWRYGNNKLLPLPCGAFVGIRLDLLPLAPVTGLPLLVEAPRMPVPDASAVSSCGEASCPRSGALFPPPPCPETRRRCHAHH
jgi:SAM-dependent methyltransferase